MSSDLSRQKKFWDCELNKFDSIYSHDKGKISNFLDSVFRWDMYARFEYVMNNVQPIENRTFLDVGCGTGRYSIELARRNSKKVVGIDISENMINECIERARKEHCEDICTFLETDLLAYETDTTFDVCIAMGLFDYIKDPLPLLSKMKESVADKVIISFPRRWTWRAPIRKIRLLIKGCDVYFYTKKDIKGLLERAGFRMSEIQKIGKLYCVSAFV